MHYLVFIIVTLLISTNAHAGDQEFLNGIVVGLEEAGYNPAVDLELESPSSITAKRDYHYSCFEFRASVLSGDSQLEGGAVGFMWGVADMLAGLHCFVRDPLCQCLRDRPVRDSFAFGRQVGDAIASCPGGNTAWGAIMVATMDYCRF